MPLLVAAKNGDKESFTYLLQHAIQIKVNIVKLCLYIGYKMTPAFNRQLKTRKKITLTQSLG